MIFNDDDSQEPIAEGNFNYGHPLGTAYKEMDDDYEYYWSFVPQRKNEDVLNFPVKEKVGLSHNKIHQKKQTHISRNS